VLALSQADEYYQGQQRLAKMIRRGFLDLAKARQSVGPSSTISALDCREELVAQYMIEADPNFAGLDASQAGTADAWRPYEAKVAMEKARSLRKRGSLDDDRNEEQLGLTREDSDIDEAPVDTVLLFAGFPP
jgi:hypothetical protein